MVEGHADLVALHERTRSPQEKVTQPKTGILPIECVLSVASRIRPHRDRPVRHVRAQPDLVTAAHQRQLITHLEGVVVAGGFSSLRLRDGEATGHAQLRFVNRGVVVQLGSEVRRGKEVVVEPVDRRSVERDSHRIDRIAAHDARLAQGQGLSQVVDVGPQRGQRIAA